MSDMQLLDRVPGENITDPAFDGLLPLCPQPAGTTGYADCVHVELLGPTGSEVFTEQNGPSDPGI